MSETFYVTVNKHNNYSMEGKVVWAESGKKKSFTTTLEMLTLMESALDRNGPMNFKTWNKKE